MTCTARIDTNDSGLTRSLQTFFKSVLDLEEIQALMVPMRQSGGQAVMPTLVTHPDRLDRAAPLAPAFPLNAARMAARLTRKPMAGKIAAVLRPCEIRAFVELVKLKQGCRESLVIIGIDCPGAYSNRDYAAFSQSDAAPSDDAFCQAVFDGPDTLPGGIDLSPACRACEHPIPDNADLAIALVGLAPDDPIRVTAGSDTGKKLIKALGLPAAEIPDTRQAAVATLVAGRIEYRDRLFAETAQAVNSMEKMSQYVAACVNCYNCRVACPVCYCRECVFVTDAFDHEPAQYLNWSARKGAVKMPTDTVFYHITRLAHMSTACVGCGQCSNACPNDIPVMELFRLVSHRTQQAFEYSAGKSLDDPPPLSVFREDEFPEVVGIGPVAG